MIFLINRFRKKTPGNFLYSFKTCTLTETSESINLVSNKVCSCFLSSLGGSCVDSSKSLNRRESELLKGNKMPIWNVPIVTTYGFFKKLIFKSAEIQIERSIYINKLQITKYNTQTIKVHCKVYKNM